ncbi:1854_t:CDS:1 [Ambispora leptoticha]|uniref:1854_t:CDS:1 n=1 Tax=Ambispora leptoticha TaxID=144679 RepID=A0A9N9B5U2_9GLOM|nr:1854_t:CDS:1 [Ambispora leptoticha]
MWKLSMDLITAFEIQNPKDHYLFSTAQELTEQGYQRLFNLYNNGIQRTRAILRQDVYGLEDRITIGRRKREIIRYKNSDLNIKKKRKSEDTKSKDKIQTEYQPKRQKITETLSKTLKKIRRQTTTKEKEILNQFLLYSQLNDQIINDIQEKIPTWDKKRLRNYYYNNRNKK